MERFGTSPRWSRRLGFRVKRQQPCVGPQIVDDVTASLLQDIVIAGQDRDYITVLAWPSHKSSSYV